MDFNTLDKERIAKMYNEMDEIWPESDKWYKYTHECMIKYINSFSELIKYTDDPLILNLGSGGNEYCIKGNHYHVDIAEEKIKNCKNAFVASIEDLPFQNNFFDGCLCVGSVIDYCDPYAVISEISRTLKKGSYCIFDFEQSNSWQFIGSKEYKTDVAMVDSFNGGYTDRIWIFSYKYIKNILDKYSLEVVRVERFHLLSPLLYKITKNEEKSAILAKLDPIIKRIPFIRNKSCNIILTVKKV